MAVEPTGSISLAQEHLRVTVADCATFRELVGADNRAEALAHLYHDGLPAPANGTNHTVEELEELRPWGIVFTDGHNGFRRRQVSVSTFRSGGRLKLRLCRSCAELADDEPTSEASLEWKNLVGQIVAELCELAVAGSPDHLAFDEVVMEFGPFASAPKLAPTQGTWQGVELAFEWGGL